MGLNIFFRINSYLDPGTSSFLIQFILGGLVGIVVIVKIFWNKIIGYFKGNKTSIEEDINQPESENNDKRNM